MSLRIWSRWLAVAGVALLAWGGARAEPTRITVRVLSKGAKFVGTSMGGARVTVRDAHTGELLAEGLVSGGTGDTGKLMLDERAPGALRSSEGSAKLELELDLDEPRWIEVSAIGPVGQPQAANRASSTQWVVPGKHVTGGDGWLLELPGFAVDVLAPPAHVKLRGLPQTVTLRANLTMM